MCCWRLSARDGSFQKMVVRVVGGEDLLTVECKSSATEDDVIHCQLVSIYSVL